MSEPEPLRESFTEKYTSPFGRLFSSKPRQKLIGDAIRRESPTLHIVGLALMFVAAGMFLSALIEWGSSESSNELALLLGSFICLAAGIVLWQSTHIQESLNIVDIFSVVSWTWVACSLGGALPYLLAGNVFGFSQWDSAIFESISGFSCTGSTVLSDIESVGRGMLFWRQLTQWYGGMGMVVLAVSVLPYVGVGGLGLISAEAPGSADRLVPRVSETAQRLWMLYIGLTALVAAALFIIPGPNLYDSVTHALTIASTGGFSTYNQSLGHFNSLAVELLAAVGLIVCAMSFSMHYRAFKKGSLRVYSKQKDQMFFLKLVGAAIAAVALLNWNSELFEGFWESLRHAVFNVATLATSGGFSNATGSDSLGNFSFWAPGVQMILLLLMVVGGCVGSTAGGLKTYRVYLTGIHMKLSLRKMLHSNSVHTPKLGTTTVPEDIVRRVLGFVTLYVLFIGVGTIVLASLGSDFITSLSGAASAMGNMGPALGDAGPTDNFLAFSRPARGILSALMLIGRLEIMAILLMFVSPYRFLRNLRK